ncbi:MAG: toll/interleukin-1 receptor domain-containing protein [Burkholderiaceae bacterium]
MADLFVSYSREDKARAEEVVRLLEDYGWDVFWDQETRAGTLWPKVLEEELVKASCLVALWTTTSIASRWVRIEAYEALQNEKLVPVLLDEVRPPLEFRQTQTFDLIGWNGDRQDPRLAHLLADLTELAKAPSSHSGTSRPVKLVVPPTLQREKAATVDSPPPGDDYATSSSRGVMLGAGVAAAVVAVAWLISVVDFSPEPAEPTKSVAATPSAPPAAVVTPAPAPADPQPAKATTVATGVPPAPQVSKSVSKPPTQQLRPSRCLAIEEKFQQTGQITVTEQDILRSKECQS